MKEFLISPNKEKFLEYGESKNVKKKRKNIFY